MQHNKWLRTRFFAATSRCLSLWECSATWNVEFETLHVYRWASTSVPSPRSFSISGNARWWMRQSESNAWRLTWRRKVCRCRNEWWQQNTNSWVPTFEYQHLSTNMWVPSFEYQHLSTNIWIPTSEHQHWNTNIWVPTFEYQHLSTNIWAPSFEYQHLSTNLWIPTSEHQHWNTNIWIPTSEHQHLSTNIWVPTNLSTKNAFRYGTNPCPASGGAASQSWRTLWVALSMSCTHLQHHNTSSRLGSHPAACHPLWSTCGHGAAG